MLAAGDKLGRFLLKEKLGQGGMGIVFLAVQEGLGREVALKILPEERVTRGPDARRRFLREAAVCARLSHPNVIKIFDYGVEDNCYYYAMEVLRTTSLEDELKRQPVASLERTFRVARDLASAFEHFHPMGLVHRDIKPANVMLGNQGQSILTDFGLVKDLQATAITREGAAVGTPYYMAPEQILGMPVNGSTDIYQLGVVLYRMLTGVYPFGGANAGEVFGQILTGEARPLRDLNPGVPVPLQNVVLNCLGKKQEARYRSARELTADLALAAGRDTVPLLRDARNPRRQEHPDAAATAPSEAKPEPGQRVVSVAGERELEARGRRIAAVAAAALLVVAGVSMLGIRSWRDGEPVELDVQTRLGFERAAIEWPRVGGGPEQLEWGEAGKPARQATVESAAPATLRSVVGPLRPDREYRFRLLGPSGRKSLEHRLVVPGSHVRLRDVQATAAGAELLFETGLPCRASMECNGRTTREERFLTSHRLSLASARPATGPVSLSLLDSTGATLAVSASEVRAMARRELLPQLLGELPRELGAFPFDSFLLRTIDRQLPPAVCTGAMIMLENQRLEDVLQGASDPRVPRYASFAPGDPLALRLAARIAEEVEKAAFHRSLPKLLFAGPGLFDERKLPPAQTQALLDALQRLRDLDHYAGFLRIPYSTGVESLFDQDFRVRYSPQLAQKATLEHDIPGSTRWGHPWKEYALGEATGMRPGTLIMTPPHDWRPSLPDPAKISRIELALAGVRLEGELFFRVTVNGRLRLVFRPEPGFHAAGRSGSYDCLSMTFDPRFLQTGENLFHVEIDALPGTRYMTLKRGNNLKGLRLTWQ